MVHCKILIQLFSSQKQRSPVFSTVVWPPPYTSRCLLSCANITYFISASVALSRLFNTASKNENNTEGMSIQFLVKSFPKTTPSLWTHRILKKRIRLLSYYQLLPLSIQCFTFSSFIFIVISNTMSVAARHIQNHTSYL